MTLRETFDRVKAHLLAQNERASSRTAEGIENCKYRHRLWDGATLSCAVGCLIPADASDEDVARAEGIDVSYLMHTAEGRWAGGGPTSNALATLLNRAGVPADQDAHVLLRQLQGLHDGYEPELWAERLDAIERELFQ